MATEVVMPQMGESIAEGTITRWLKKVGEQVERDEPLFEISTDKVDAEIPSPAAGTLSQVNFNEGDTVEVNKVVAYIGDGDGAAAAPAAQEARAIARERSRRDLPRPRRPRRRRAPAPTLRAARARSSAAAATCRAGSAQQAGASAQAAAPPQADARTRAEQSAEELRRTRSSPLVRKIAAEHGVDITRLEGTGTSGRVTKNDILSFIESGAHRRSGPAARSRAARGLVRCARRSAAAARPARRGRPRRADERSCARRSPTT